MAKKTKAAVMFYDIEDSKLVHGLFEAVGHFRDGTVLRTEPSISYKAASTALGVALDAMVRDIPPELQEAFCKDKLWTDDTPEARTAGEGMWSLGVSYDVVEKRESPEVFELSLAQIWDFGILQELNRIVLHACGISICVEGLADGKYRIYFEMQKHPQGGFLLSTPADRVNDMHERSSIIYALRNLNAALRRELGAATNDTGVQLFSPYPNAFDLLRISRSVDNRLIALYPELAPDEPKDDKKSEA